MGTRLIIVYDKLFERFGKQYWWPAETEFEVIVGAILTQSTAWTNVEKAITNLKNARVLDPKSLAEIDSEELAGLIRPAGYYNAKAKKLKSFTEYLMEKYKGDLELMLDQPTEQLRRELLSVWGIGPETADSILLYAARKPSFVVDAYTKRIFSRMGFVKCDIDYESLKEFSEENLPTDVGTFNEFHALLVKLGKEHCRTKPVCVNCPLYKECKKTRS